MNMIEVISIIQILTGALVMLCSVILGLKIKKTVPKNLGAKWFLIVTLMGFFLFGYLLSAGILLMHITVPFELITGSMFLAGAGFVLIIMKLSKTTIQSMNSKDKELQRTLLEIAEIRDAEEERLANMNIANEHLRIVLNNTESVNRARGEFISKINEKAHTPLHEIVHWSESVLDTPLTPEQKMNIQAIKESARNIVELLDSVKGISRPKPAH